MVGDIWEDLIRFAGYSYKLGGILARGSTWSDLPSFFFSRGGGVGKNLEKNLIPLYIEAC